MIMEKYCEFKKTYNKSSTKYLLSASLFLLSKSYKKSYKYINGLKTIYEFIKKNKDYTLRIYYDDSIYNDSYYSFTIDNLLKNKERVELINFKCTPFMINSNIHKGTFGTLLRFLPLFENSNYKVINIIDIDDKDYDYIDMHFKKIENSKYNVFGTVPKDYSSRYDYEFDNKFNNVVIANIYVKDYRFDIKLFTDYLNYLSKSNELYKKIRKINSQFMDVKKVRSDILESYGVDEYFLNKILINKLDKSQIYFSKENKYITYFLDNLIIYDSQPSNLIIFYLQEIISEFYPEIFNKSYTINSLKDLLYDAVNIESNSKYKNMFFSNYSNTVNKFKDLTLKYYYSDSFYIFDEKYIDLLIENDSMGISWYLKKYWNILPKHIKDNLKL